MSFCFARVRAGLAAALVALAAAAGCAQCRIPAIDPTGQHIFAGSTTLASHDGIGGLFHHNKNQPAAVAPAQAIAPVKPPCTPPVVAVPVAPLAIAPPVAIVPQNPLPPVPVIPVACGPQTFQPQMVLPGKPQPGGPVGTQPDCPGPELAVTPSRIVAPVNTEVVMAAGIRSPDGYYVTRQPLEWMLAQDGVGQIVAVGHESPHDTSFLLRNSPQKVATNYARAHTSTISQVLNRGTKNPADDVYLNKGQSWISITSPTEGTSHVVVWAPKEMNWERRKATATIYWVDAAWRFPPSVTARAGQPQPLTTVVTRSNGDPISGWFVRYEVVDGPPATFLRGGPSAEVRTDGAGRGTVDISPATPDPGITTVRVQVIRPGSTRGDLPQMVVGQTTIAVQWTTPGLAVRAIGSSAVLADGAVAYRVEVANDGDLLTRNVVLSYTPPTGVTVLNSTPSAQVFGQRYQWQFGDLPPGTAQVVELNCRATVAGAIRSSFLATSAEVPRAEGRVTTDVRLNALVVKMTGPETVEVGREAKFLVDVTNNGSVPLNNVVATDTFEPGLSHTGGERSPLVRPIPSIGPGQTERFAVSFIVTQPGRLCHRLDITADGGHAAGARGCVTGTGAVVTPPQISMRVNGPATRRVGDVASYVVELRNNGSSPANDVQLAVTWGPGLELSEATQGHQDDVTRLTTRWRITSLGGGETITRQLNFNCTSANEQGAFVRATVNSQQTPTVNSQATTAILPSAAPARPAAPAGPAMPFGPTTPPQSPPAGPAAITPPPSTPGNLRLRVSALADPIRVGEVSTFVISLGNGAAASDRNVAVSVRADDGLIVTRSLGSPVGVASANAAALDYSTIAEIRTSEELTFRVEARGAKPGRYKLRVTATSELVRGGTSGEAEITVNQ